MDARILKELEPPIARGEGFPFRLLTRLRLVPLSPPERHYRAI